MVHILDVSCKDTKFKQLQIIEESMEGKLSTEADKDPPSGPTRRRVLKASAALSATGVVGSRFVGSAGATHEPCPRSIQCQAGIDFRSQTVNDGCPKGTAPDSVTVGSVNVTCPNGGWVDLHDTTTKTGPSGTFGAGYPVGMSTFLQQGTHTGICINLFENPDTVGSCTVKWDRNEWPTNANSLACRSMNAILHLDSPADGTFTHYCDHVGHKMGNDHAYLCDLDNDGTLEMIQDVAVVCGDGTV